MAASLDLFGCASNAPDYFRPPLNDRALGLLGCERAERPQLAGELCNDLKASVACGRSVSIECKAHSLAISMDQATSLGLIVNELVTNAIKHAFPHGRTGRIRVAFEAFKGELRPCVEDDGVGFCPHTQTDAGMGQELVSGLAGQLSGSLEVASTTAGSSFRLSVPCASPVLPSRD
jgi:two-component sensor histidine kinase